MNNNDSINEVFCNQKILYLNYLNCILFIPIIYICAQVATSKSDISLIVFLIFLCIFNIYQTTYILQKTKNKPVLQLKNSKLMINSIRNKSINIKNIIYIETKQISSGRSLLPAHTIINISFIQENKKYNKRFTLFYLNKSNLNKLKNIINTINTKIKKEND